MDKTQIKEEIKDLMAELKEAKQSGISSWIDETVLKLENLHLLLERGFKMKIIVSYSADLYRSADSWNEEEYDNRDEAEQSALDLLYSGYYVSLAEV